MAEDGSRIVGGVVLGGTALVAGGYLGLEASNKIFTPEYILTEIDPHEEEEQFKEDTRFLSLLLKVGEPQIPLDRNLRFARTEGHLGSYTLDIVHSSEDRNFKIPSEQQLNAAYDFLKNTRQHWDPVSYGKMYVGDLGDGWAATAPKTLGPDIGRNTISEVNTNLEGELKSDPFWTEFCQTTAPAGIEDIRNPFADSIRLETERECNSLGVAMYAAERNIPYDEYVQLAQRQGHLPGGLTISLFAYTERQYKYLTSQFGQAENEEKAQSEKEQAIKDLAVEIAMKKVGDNKVVDEDVVRESLDTDEGRKFAHSLDSAVQYSQQALQSGAMM